MTDWRAPSPRTSKAGQAAAARAASRRAPGTTAHAGAQRVGRLRVTRSAVVLALSRQLSDAGFPRLQMALIGALTGAFGLLASFTMLHAGVHAMALRYPLALGLAYGFFLLLLWLWLRTRAEDWADFSDGGIDLVPSFRPDLPDPGFRSGGGGDFGGGGASGSFDDPAGATRLADPSPMTGDTSALSSIGEAAGSAGDADELAIPLIVIALIVGLALASFYVVVIAPSLMAELLLDGALSYSLYRRLRGVERRHWFGTALRRTALPFAVTAVFLALVGWAMTQHAPGARSIGEVMKSERRP